MPNSYIVVILPGDGIDDFRPDAVPWQNDD